MADVELSPTEWVQDQTKQILETGTTEGVSVLGRPIVLLTVRDAKIGKLRYTPVMRVEHDGSYAVVASKGGAPEHATWYHNSNTQTRDRSRVHLDAGLGSRCSCPCGAWRTGFLRYLADPAPGRGQALVVLGHSRHHRGGEVELVTEVAELGDQPGSTASGNSSRGVGEHP